MRLGKFTENLFKAFKNFALVLSFTVNIILVVVLIVVVQQIFIIKNGIGEPLIDGLHRNFVLMDEADIVSDVKVDDTLDIDFDLLINQPTTVIIQEPVPLSATTSFALPGGGGTINGQVNLSLPVGLELPIMLNMIVPVEETIPVKLNVPVNIPLSETELHEPFRNLRLLLEPYVKTLDNLPGDWDETPNFAADMLTGNRNLLDETEGSRDPTGSGTTASDSEPAEAITETDQQTDPSAEPVEPAGNDTTSQEAPSDMPSNDPTEDMTTQGENMGAGGAVQPQDTQQATPRPTATTVPFQPPASDE